MTNAVRKAVIPAAGLGHEVPARYQGPAQGDAAGRRPAGDPVRGGRGRACRHRRHPHHHGPRQAQPRGPLRPVDRARGDRSRRRASTSCSPRCGAWPTWPTSTTSARARRWAWATPCRWPASTWAASPSWSCSATTSWTSAPPCSADMITAYGDTASSVVAFKSFPPEEISSYGCAEAEPTDDRQPGTAAGHRREAQARGRAQRPGRHGPLPVHARDLRRLDRTKPGVGGEIQLTDAIAILLAEQPVYGFVFDEGRFDIGKKLDYLRATVELALDRDDLGPEFASLPGRGREAPGHRLGPKPRA